MRLRVAPSAVRIATSVARRARACQQEIGDVDAGDQEHEQHRRDKQEQQWPDRSRLIRFERNNRDACAFVDRPDTDRRDRPATACMSPCALFQGDVWLQTADDVHRHRDLAIAKARRVPEAKREIHVAAMKVSRVVLKRRRDHADDDVRCPAQRQRLTDRGWRRAKLPTARSSRRSARPATAPNRSSVARNVRPRIGCTPSNRKKLAETISAGTRSG